MAQATETASLGNNTSKRRLRRTSAAVQWAQTILTFVYRKTLALFASIPLLILSLIRRIDNFCGNVEVEQPKAIVHTFIPLQSLWQAFTKCSIHFVSVALTTVLAGLNLGTLFIGDEFQGPNQGYWQDFDKLALQIAAKLFEFLIVASLSAILIDLLRHDLLEGSSGLPLGLLTAKTQFIAPGYLISPDFRYGIVGLEKKKMIWAAILIAGCSVLALVAGPAAALLLVPQAYDDWNAGGANFYLVGAKESLWPPTLDSQSIGGEHCRSPSESDISLQMLNMSSCIWSGYRSIFQWTQSENQAGSTNNIPIHDGGVYRVAYIRRHPDSSGISYGVSLAPCLYANVLSSLWRNATVNASMAQLGTTSRLSGIRYRKPYVIMSSISSQIPVVRTNCLTTYPVVFKDLVGKTFYPLQPEYPSSFLDAMVASGTPANLSTVPKKQYTFNTTTYTDSPEIATIWLETPADELIGTRIHGGSVTGRSSAYLNVQIPYLNQSAGLHAACAIDACWVQSSILGSNVGEEGDASYLASTIGPADTTHALFPAIDDGNWRSVRLGIDWLETLTPQIGDTKYWTTLASIIANMRLNNSTGLLDSWDGVGVSMATAISTVVVDGMSRSGYLRNGGRANKSDEPWPLKYTPGEDSFDPLLKGSYVLPFGREDGGNLTDRTEMYWSVMATGLGFRAASSAYYLAPSVFFIHASLAIGHSIWVFRGALKKNGGNHSTAWNSLTDLLALALLSTPPASALDNASAGINRFRTLKEPIRIRAANGRGLGEESTDQGSTVQVSRGVEIIVGADYIPKDHKKVTPGKLY